MAWLGVTGAAGGAGMNLDLEHPGDARSAERPAMGGPFPDLKSASARLHDRARAVLPGGNSRHTVHFPPYPIYAERAFGSRVWDADGNERIDLINNYSALIHGHNHPAILRAMFAQAQKMLCVSLPTESEIALAELLVDRLASVEQVRFCNSGSEAVMFAIKAARAYTGRSKIAKIEGAYHGSAESAAAGGAGTPQNWGPVARPVTEAGAGHGRGTADDIILLPFNEVEAARAILRDRAADLAGVLIDPLINALGFAAVSPEFIRMVRDEMDRSGGLLIFDEVYTFRLGYTGAQGAVGIRPDITALGKIIGGGLPVGAVGGRRAIMTALFDPAQNAPLAHGGTFNANPMTMAAGLAAMRMMDEIAYDRLALLGNRLRRGLAEVLAIARRPGRVTGAASVARLWHSDAEAGSYRNVVAIRADEGARARQEGFFRQMLNRGVLMGAPGIFVLSTPVTEDEVDFTCEAALAALRAI